VSSTVRDVMSTHVIAVRQGAPYKDMAAMLHDQRISAFPVIDDDNKVIGVVSETDLLTKEALELNMHGPLQGLMRQRERSKVNGVTAADLMTKPAVTIGPDEPVAHGPPDVQPASQAAPRQQRGRNADRHRVPR
jgi:CBS domain-containing protein